MQSQPRNSLEIYHGVRVRVRKETNNFGWSLDEMEFTYYVINSNIFEKYKIKMFILHGKNSIECKIWDISVGANCSAVPTSSNTDALLLSFLLKIVVFGIYLFQIYENYLKEGHNKNLDISNDCLSSLIMNCNI